MAMADVLRVSFGPRLEKARTGGPLRFGASRIDLAGRLITVGDTECRIEPRAAAVLALLIAEPGTVVRRERLLDACWPPGEGSDEALTQAIAQLRRALRDDPRSPAYIVTVPKAGYRWIARPPAAARRRFPRLSRAAAVAGGLALVGAGVIIGGWLTPPPPVTELETQVVLVRSGPGPMPPLPDLPRR